MPKRVALRTGYCRIVFVGDGWAGPNKIRAARVAGVGKMAGVYTPELVAELRSVGAFTYASAVAFAAVHGLKPKSVIAKIHSEGVAYEAKPKPIAKKVENELPKKADVLSEIFEKIGIELASMDRMTVAELMVLNDSIARDDSADPADSADVDGNVA